MLEILLLSFALSLDCFTVSVASGTILKKPRFRQALKFGLFFGGFQMLMPLIGWAAGLGFLRWVSRYDHWVAFGLLLAVGIKMLYEAFKKNAEEEELKKKKNLLSNITLLILALATSIDALAVGLSIHVLSFPVFSAAAIIGATSFLISIAGVYIGKKIGHFIGNKVEILGGLIIIGIGVKILLENIG